MSAELERQIHQRAPWHHHIQITEDCWTGTCFHPSGILHQDQNQGVSLIHPHRNLLSLAEICYPDTLFQKKRFLDCACNGGGYCYSVRDLGAETTFGFDVREHWIHQAEFIKANRTVAPVEDMTFKVLDLYDLPGEHLAPFDFTFFSGIFYHLPDPVTGLKIAADLTSDVLYVNTAGGHKPEDPSGLTMKQESTRLVMSGVHQMSWLPNGSECVKELLLWLGFQDIRLKSHRIKAGNLTRFAVLAGREPDRFEHTDLPRI